MWLILILQICQICYQFNQCKIVLSYILCSHHMFNLLWGSALLQLKENYQVFPQQSQGPPLVIANGGKCFTPSFTKERSWLSRHFPFSPPLPRPKPKPNLRQREHKQLFTHRLMLPAAFQWPCSRQEKAQCLILLGLVEEKWLASFDQLSGVLISVISLFC